MFSILADQKSVQSALKLIIKFHFNLSYSYRAILEIQHALCVFTEVYASLWPLDPTPRLITRLFIEYEFGAAYRDSEKERCR